MMTTEPAIAPPGWGFHPGETMMLSLDGLPDFYLANLTKISRFKVVVSELRRWPTLIPTLTSPKLRRKYPELTLMQCYEAIQTARITQKDPRAIARKRA